MSELIDYVKKHDYIHRKEYFIDDDLKELANKYKRDVFVKELSSLVPIYSELGNLNIVLNLCFIINQAIIGDLFNSEIIHELFYQSHVTDEEYNDFKYRVRKEKNEIISCVYKITCKENGKFYIGSTTDLIKRRIVHRFELRFHRHFNRFLQADFERFGDDNFKFSIIEQVGKSCSRISLYKLEQKYMDELNPDYNIIRIVTYPSKKNKKHKKRKPY